MPWHLTHWGRVTHICVSKLTIIGSDNGLSPGRRQAIIWTNAGILLIRPLGTNFNEILIEILTFSLMKMRLKVSSAKWRPFCLGFNVLTGNKILPKPTLTQTSDDKWLGQSPQWIILIHWLSGKVTIILKINTELQWVAVIMQSNITCYHIQHWHNSNRT